MAKKPTMVEGYPLDLHETKPTIGGSWNGRDTSLIYVRSRTLHNHFEPVTRGSRLRSRSKKKKREGDVEPSRQESYHAIFVVITVRFDQWESSNWTEKAGNHEDNRAGSFLGPWTRFTRSLHGNGEEQAKGGRYPGVYIHQQRQKLPQDEISPWPGPDRVGSYREKKWATDERGDRTGWQCHRWSRWWSAGE